MRTVIPSDDTPGRALDRAIFGPTGVGKTEVAIALAERLRRRGRTRWRSRPTRMQVYAACEILTGAATPPSSARLEHRLLGVAAVTEPFSAGALRAARTCRDRRGDRRRAAADRRRRHRPVPARRAGRARPAPAADPELRARWDAALEARGPAALHAALAAARARGRRADRPRPTASASSARWSCSTPASAAAAAASQLWTTDTRHPTLLAGLVMDRDALYARIDARVDAMVAAGAARRGPRAPHAAGASATAARRSASRSCWRATSRR